MRFTIDTLSASYYSLIIALSFSLYVVAFIGKDKDNLIIHQALRSVNIFILAIGQMMIVPDTSLFVIVSIAESLFFVYLIIGSFVKAKHPSQNAFTLLSVALSFLYLWAIANSLISESIYTLDNSDLILTSLMINLLTILFGLVGKWDNKLILGLTSNALAMLSLFFISGINAFVVSTIFKAIFYLMFIYLTWRTIERYYLIQYNLDKANELKIYQNLSDKNKALAQVIQEENNNLVMATRIDSATGALNKKGLYEKLDQLIDNPETEVFSIIVFDIDNFKQVNDNYGHLIGDKCLQELADKAKNTIRSSDYLGRFGGDEFIIMLPGASREVSADLAERLRLRIESSQDPHFTISLGIASFPDDGIKKESLIEVADTGLYYAKEHGRNRTSYSLPRKN